LLLGREALKFGRNPTPQLRTPIMSESLKGIHPNLYIHILFAQNDSLGLQYSYPSTDGATVAVENSIITMIIDSEIHTGKK